MDDEIKKQVKSKGFKPIKLFYFAPFVSVALLVFFIFQLLRIWKKQKKLCPWDKLMILISFLLLLFLCYVSYDWWAYNNKSKEKRGMKDLAFLEQLFLPVLAFLNLVYLLLILAWKRSKQKA